MNSRVLLILLFGGALAQLHRPQRPGLPTLRSGWPTVQYTYRYSATLGHGFETNKAFVGTGLEADVTVVPMDDGETLWIQIGNATVIQVRKADGSSKSKTIVPMDTYQIEKAFKAYPYQRQGQVTMDVPENDSTDLINLRLGVVNTFRSAIVRDVELPEVGELQKGWTQERDTFTGRCTSLFTTSRLPGPPLNKPLQDIQSMSARKSSGGNDIKLEEKYYSLHETIDFNTCVDENVLVKTTDVNVTGLRFNNLKHMTSRSYTGMYELKGNNEQRRVEWANVLTVTTGYPLEKVEGPLFTTSNQTMRLLKALTYVSPLPMEPTKSIRVWQNFYESPKERGPTSPEWIDFKNKRELSSPIYYERIMGHNWNNQQKLIKLCEEKLEMVAVQLEKPNKEDLATPSGATADGKMAENMYDCTKLAREMTFESLIELKRELKNDKTKQILFYDLLAAAGTGPTLRVLFDDIPKLDKNRVATFFMTLTSNINSPEQLANIERYVTMMDPEDNVFLTSVARVNLAKTLRLMCSNAERGRQSYWFDIYGKDNDCHHVLEDYKRFLEEKLRSKIPTWRRVINIVALGELGEDAIDAVLVAAGGKKADRWEDDRAVRIAAIQSLSKANYNDNVAEKVRDNLLAVAESQSEDYRVRQMAYITLLTWFDRDVKFIKSLAAASRTESSLTMYGFYTWIIESLAEYSGLEDAEVSAVSRELVHTVKYMSPSLYRPMMMSMRAYDSEEEIGHLIKLGWLSKFEGLFPAEVYGYLQGKFCDTTVPILEYLSTKAGPVPTQDKLEKPTDFYTMLNIHSSSKVYLPLVNNLYRNTKTERLSGEDEVQKLLKYFAHVETISVMPYPIGIFMKYERATPVLLHTHRKNPPTWPEKTPSIDNLDWETSGITKLTAVTVESAVVMNPLSMVKVKSQIKNEKTFSLPVNGVTKSSFKNAGSIIWTKLRTTFPSHLQYPILKIANEVEIISELAHTVFVKVVLPIRPSPRSNCKFTLDKKFLGLELEVDYKSDTTCLWNKYNLWYTLVEHPSKMLSLLDLPTSRPFSLTVRRNPRSTENVKFGLQLRSLREEGKTGDLMKPDLLKISPVKSLVERREKLSKFAPRGTEVTEWSIRLNSTAEDDLSFLKEYELTAISATKNVSDQNSLLFKNNGKVQLSLSSFNEEWSKILPKKSIHLVSTFEKPQMVSTATVLDLAQVAKLDKLKLKVDGKLFYGEDNSGGLKANLWVTRPRVETFTKVSHNKTMQYLSNRKLSKMAIYDKGQIDASLDIKNDYSLLWWNLRETVEGALFPHLTEFWQKPELSELSQSLRIKFNRTLPENTLDASIMTQESTYKLNYLRVWSWLDSLTTYLSPAFYTHTTGNDVVTPLGEHACTQTPAYLVTPVGEDLCVSTVSSPTCKPWCRAADSWVIRTRSKCWPEDQAPEKVREGRSWGYVEKQVFDWAPVKRWVDHLLLAKCWSK